MAERVVLHVGAMKSGTSYLQGLVVANRDLLATRGLLFPGAVWRDQVSGVADVLQRQRVAVPAPEGAWQALVEEMAAWPGTALVSMEFLGPATVAAIERVVATLPRGRVQVVVTARDLNRAVPAMWQETLKNGRHFTFDEYVEAVRTHEGPGKAFWREQTIAAMCRRWSDVVGTDRVTVVTVPPPGAPRDVLWRRFAEAVGVEADGLATPASGNESLGAASAQVLRRLNERLEDLPFPEFATVVKHRLAKGTLGPRRAQEPAVGFEVPDWLPPLAERMVGRLRDLGVRVVGDLADLTPVPVPGVHPDTVALDLQLDAATDALESLVRGLAERTGATTTPTPGIPAP